MWARICQQTSGLTSTYPQTEMKEHAFSLGVTCGDEHVESSNLCWISRLRPQLQIDSYLVAWLSPTPIYWSRIPSHQCSIQSTMFYTGQFGAYIYGDTRRFLHIYESIDSLILLAQLAQSLLNIGFHRATTSRIHVFEVTCLFRDSKFIG